MPEDLDSLLKKIQDEAVEKAEEKAHARLEAAEKKAKEIVQAAEKKAQEIVSEAEKKAEQFAENGRISLEHAARDLLIYLRSAITAQFDALFRDDAAKVVSLDVVQEILKNLAAELQKSDKEATDVRIFVAEDDQKKVTDFFAKNYKDALKKGVEIQPLPSIKAGFRVEMRDNDVVYDFSDDVIVTLLRELVSPVLAARLDAAVKEKK